MEAAWWAHGLDGMRSPRGLPRQPVLLETPAALLQTQLMEDVLSVTASESSCFLRSRASSLAVLDPFSFCQSNSHSICHRGGAHFQRGISEG